MKESDGHQQPKKDPFDEALSLSMLNVFMTQLKAGLQLLLLRNFVILELHLSIFGSQEHGWILTWNMDEF